MAIDFEREYGVNAGYVQALYEDWRVDADSVDESWHRLFERLQAREGGSGGERAAAPPASEPSAAEEDPELERLSGVAARIVTNMEASLGVPTATSVRQVPAKLLDENRRILNEHLQVRALGKASYTHILAFALVRALAENPRAQSSFVEAEGKPWRRVPRSVNLGLAIDVPGPDGRMLVVPNIKQAEKLDFLEFLRAYDEVVARGRDGKLTAEDYRGTTVTLTNPGGFGTSASVPRLMQGSGLIIATGSIGVAPELAGMARQTLAQLALGPAMTMTSTYDHRVIQGADSGLLLKRVDELLQGQDGFYEDIFRACRVPWTPAVLAVDSLESRDAGEMQAQVWQLINAYRFRGGRIADLDPLEYRPEYLQSLDPATYGFTVWDLDREFLCGNLHAERQHMSLREILATLRRAYCRRWTVEYMHITDRARKHWMRARVEEPDHEFQFDSRHRVRVLELLSRAENFERFLHARYVGNKRFSLEGADTLIPALAELLDRAAEQGVERVVVGMAHRGRLNVLANIMGKSYAQIFREFESVLLPLSVEGSGDVKYHLGQRGRYTSRTGREVEVILSANPSHLEAVDPVVTGMVRAYQDELGDTDRRRVLAVLVHGDAAFSGQGVVAETFNMSALRAYGCGGTIHLVVNNQIGFTAGPRDLRSTKYCTDIAKSIEAPVMHANGDFPESVLRAVRLAVDYQREHGGDSVVDMVCYRRWGHNEGDEPAYTQPVLYSRIKKHPTVRENYTALLLRRGAIDEDQARAIGERFDAELHEALESFKGDADGDGRPGDGEYPVQEVIDLHDDDRADYAEEPSPATGVDGEVLVDLIERLNAMPTGHITHPNLLRQLARREQMVRGERDLDWGCAEALAYATLVEAGVPIRLSGQDSGRGTFSHRHAVIRDQVTEEEHIPLARLAPEKASFEVWDSLLSEEAVLGFEYGYSLARPAALVLWEAQFGDFANGAQVQFDQFVSSGQAKWGQESRLVMLLPHGYDGQGPEHSSARPERFLALCSGGNLRIANCTTSAQIFHLLRRQGLDPVRRPLVVFTPKSLLRDPRAASPVEDLTRGGFRELIPDESVPPGAARRLVLCSGKVYHDLADLRGEEAVEDVALVRLEQLYPFPRAAVLEQLQRHPGAELVWCQEEPRNMGAWSFVLQRFQDLGRAIEYAGRPESSSPATGSYSRHQAEQRRVLERALGRACSLETPSR